MFLQHGGILCWGRTLWAVREVPRPISKRAVAVGLGRASTAPATCSDDPVTSHFASRDGQMHLHHPKARCSKYRGWLVSPKGSQHRLDVLQCGNHCVQKALCYPEPSDISPNMTSLWHLLPHSNKCSNFLTSIMFTSADTFSWFKEGDAVWFWLLTWSWSSAAC